MGGIINFGEIAVIVTRSSYHSRDKKGKIKYFFDRETGTLYLNPSHYSRSQVEEYISKVNNSETQIGSPFILKLERGNQEIFYDVKNVRTLSVSSEIEKKVRTLEIEAATKIRPDSKLRNHGVEVSG